MSNHDKDFVQEQVLAHLKARKRRAFTGPIALELSLTTTSKNPSFSHKIAKNLLDLFSAPRPNVLSDRKALLYRDDEQIQSLSVICGHGGREPRISVDVRRFADVLTDLRIADDWISENDDDYLFDQSDLHNAIDDFRDYRLSETKWRTRFGDDNYVAALGFALHSAQKEFFGSSALTISDLAQMYSEGGRSAVDSETKWTRLIADNRMRIRLNELPQVSGASREYKREIDEQLNAFKIGFADLLDPVVVPVALEVVIKPPRLSLRQPKHDLDNVVNEYLIPRVLDIVKPASDDWFVLDLIRQRWPDLGARSSFPPASTKVGITRFEVWRLPQAQGDEKGFVSLAIVSDKYSSHDSMLQKIEDAVDAWKDSIEFDF
jgi:Holliday junction resolvase RusA-like endonuclease